MQSVFSSARGSDADRHRKSLVFLTQGVAGRRRFTLDLTQDLDEATFATMRDAFERYSVLVFPGQTITDDQQVRFSERFGQLEATRAGANGAGSKLIVLRNRANPIEPC